MSTKKYAFVESIFAALIRYWKLDGYKALATYIGTPYQTLMAWKKRDSIADYAPFMDKGISRLWLETGKGEMLTYQEASGYIASVSAMMREMDEDTQKDIFLSVQKEKLLRELLRERMEQKAV